MSLCYGCSPILCREWFLCTILMFGNFTEQDVVRCEDFTERGGPEGTATYTWKISTRTNGNYFLCIKSNMCFFLLYLLVLFIYPWIYSNKTYVVYHICNFVYIIKSIIYLWFSMIRFQFWRTVHQDLKYRMLIWWSSSNKQGTGRYIVFKQINNF